MSEKVTELKQRIAELEFQLEEVRENRREGLARAARRIQLVSSKKRRRPRRGGGRRGGGRR